MQESHGSCPISRKYQAQQGCPRTQSQAYSGWAPDSYAESRGEIGDALNDATYQRWQKMSPEQREKEWQQWVTYYEHIDYGESYDVYCDKNYPFRSINGSCNNLRYPHLGEVGRLYRRFLPPSYQDRISTPRLLGENGKPLPSPRLVSLVVHPTVEEIVDKYNTQWLMLWGQYLTHDISLISTATVPEEAQGCEPCDSYKIDEDCWPITIPDGDPWYPPSTVISGYKQKRCLPFTRALNGQIYYGPREQMNAQSAYIDGSPMYGTNDYAAHSLRTHRNGLLKITRDGLLIPAEPYAGCRSGRSACFQAGDPRVNQYISLAALQTIWVREHNGIADKLQEKHPWANDETIYQHTRRIVGALHQHFSYNQWLPKIVGPYFMDKFGLWARPTGRTQYDGKCDATLFIQFSAAAMRYGHTLIYEDLNVYNPYGEDESRVLWKTYFNMGELYNTTGHFLERLMRGMVDQAEHAFDPVVSTQIRERLFEDPRVPYSGSDLIATNIWRGRDVGLQPYYKYRERFGLDVPKNFQDLIDLKIMPKVHVDALAKVYKSVEDIDLFTGIISEYRMEGAVIGELGAYFLSIIFKNLKYCDRFYYEHGGQAGSFSDDQLQQLRKIVLAKTLCLNTGLNFPADVFTLGGPEIECEDLPVLDFTNWIPSPY